MSWRTFLDSIIQLIQPEMCHQLPLVPAFLQTPADGTKCNPRITGRAIQAADVDKARGVASGAVFRNANCKIYFKTVPRNEEGAGTGTPGPTPWRYTDPNPYPYYPPTCYYYYYYYAQDIYTCATVVWEDGSRETSCSYKGTRYYLEDVICF